MKNNSNLTKDLLLIFIVIKISSEIISYDLISNKTKLNPLSIYFKDSICQTYILSLFSPFPLVNYGEYDKIKKQPYKLKIKNPIMDELYYNVYLGNVLDKNILFGMRPDDQKKDCYFGLSPELQESDEFEDRNNTLEYLKFTNQTTEKKFSIDKWDLNSDMIKSKLYLGYNHENFNSKNSKYIGTCQNIIGDSYWGCYFKQMIFNNTKIPLSRTDEEDYKIYFSNEYTINFPLKFKEIFVNSSDDSCIYDNKNKKIIYKDWFNEDLFIPLSLSNDNMDITLEIDNLKRFNSEEEKDSIQITFKSIDYIIFPLEMFKNFHIQFDADNNITRFYSTNKSILNVKIKEPEQEKNTSSALTVFLVI